MDTIGNFSVPIGATQNTQYISNILDFGFGLFCDGDKKCQVDWSLRMKEFNFDNIYQISPIFDGL